MLKSVQEHHHFLGSLTPKVRQWAVVKSAFFPSTKLIFSSSTTYMVGSWIFKASLLLTTALLGSLGFCLSLAGICENIAAGGIFCIYNSTEGEALQTIIRHANAFIIKYKSQKVRF